MFRYNLQQIVLLHCQQSCFCNHDCVILHFIFLWNDWKYKNNWTNTSCKNSFLHKDCLVLTFSVHHILSVFLSFIHAVNFFLKLIHTSWCYLLVTPSSNIAKHKVKHIAIMLQALLKAGMLSCSFSKSIPKCYRGCT